MAVLKWLKKITKSFLQKRVLLLRAFCFRLWAGDNNGSFIPFCVVHVPVVVGEVTVNSRFTTA
jgi:hypothetical protein